MEEYEVGELSIQTMQDLKKFKLSGGEVILYPSTSLHKVEEVKKGERIVCVGWIQSYISNNEDRNMLFGLDAGAMTPVMFAFRARERIQGFFEAVGRRHVGRPLLPRVRQHRNRA